MNGADRKREGQERVALNNEEWLDWARNFARWFCRQAADGCVTTDDVHGWAERSGEHPTHPNAWGTVFQEKGWRRVSYVQSTRPEAHARPIGVWTWEGDDE